MKPFNLEQAKAGKPVCTRDGKDARIICWDCAGTEPIIALVKYNFDEEDDSEIAFHYGINGNYDGHDSEDEDDLFMKSTTEKRWSIFFRTKSRQGFIHHFPEPGSFGFIVSSKEEAEKELKSLQEKSSYPECYQIIEFEIEV